MKCQDDPKQGVVTFLVTSACLYPGDLATVVEEIVAYDLMIGADGADSMVRERMVQAKVMQFVYVRCVCVCVCVCVCKGSGMHTCVCACTCIHLMRGTNGVNKIGRKGMEQGKSMRCRCMCVCAINMCKHVILIFLACHVYL